MNVPYIFEANENNVDQHQENAIVVLPDIFGMTDYAKQTTQDFAKTFAVPVYMLDYFYQLTGTQTCIAQTDSESAVGLMQKMTGEDFVTIFEKAVSEISVWQKGLKNIIVIGFCFAGRLAYLCGQNSLVDTIVSFYGAGANQPGFIGGQSAIEYLVNNHNNSSLRVYSFFGTQDESIPSADRAKIQSVLQASQITHQAYEYHTGHAYFQVGRTNYNQQAAQASWQELQKII